jgi:NADH dehydrogenase
VTVLVTGGTGFIGPKVVHALRARELPVRALVREPSRGRQLESWGAELAVGDVTDPESLRRAVEGCDVVVHLVGLMRAGAAEYERVMTQGTRDLVEAARAAGVRRFVLMSALGVDERTKDLVPYYRAKWDMERIVEGSGLEHVIFRPSFVFGRDGGALGLFVRLARWMPVTPIAGSGDQRIQPIWVEDVAEFFARSVDEPAAANRTFEIGGPDAVDWNELYARIKRTLGTRRPSVHVPMSVLRVQATLTDWFPKAPVSRDQLKMLAAGDNTCDVRPALEVFKVPLVGLDEQLRRAI